MIKDKPILVIIIFIDGNLNKIIIKRNNNNNKIIILSISLNNNKGKKIKFNL